MPIFKTNARKLSTVPCQSEDLSVDEHEDDKEYHGSGHAVLEPFQPMRQNVEEN
jgi:hypothetical protein